MLPLIGPHHPPKCFLRSVFVGDFWDATDFLSPPISYSPHLRLSLYSWWWPAFERPTSGSSWMADWLGCCLELDGDLNLHLARASGRGPGYLPLQHPIGVSRLLSDARADAHGDLSSLPPHSSFFSFSSSFTVVIQWGRGDWVDD